CLRPALERRSRGLADDRHSPRVGSISSPRPPCAGWCVIPAMEARGIEKVIRAQNVAVRHSREPTDGVILLVTAQRLLYCPLRLIFWAPAACIYNRSSSSASNPSPTKRSS